MFPFVRSAALLAAGLAAPVVSAGQQTCANHDLLYRLDGGTLLWTDVKGVSTNDSLLVVLTESDPVIHLFDLADGTRYRSWGRRGEGPGEFRTSTGIELVGRHVYALDTNQERLSIFELTGELVRTVRLQDFGVTPPQSSVRLERTEGEAILIGMGEIMGTERIITAQTIRTNPAEDSSQDTVAIYQYSTAPVLHLAAEGAPSYSLPPPYSPSARWTSTADGIVLWRGPDTEVSILNFDGTPKSTLSLALDDRFEITEEDREHWLQNAIPREFMGQRVFEPVRQKARETVDFPLYHPPVFGLLSGPDNLLWVRRTPRGRETQVWDVVDSQGQPAARVSFAAGLALMAIIPNHLVLRSADEFDVESIELHRCSD